MKQSLNMEMAIVMARVSIFLWLSLMLYLDTLFVVLNLLKYQDAGMDWILHLDTDELIYPAGAREYSLRRLLLDVPPNVDMVIFPNYVSQNISCLLW